MSIPVRFSERALAHIRQLRQSMNLNDTICLRIGVKGGKGCMGVEKLIAFDEKGEKDEEFEVDGIRVVIRRGESLYLAGMEIDYLSEENSKGFVFRD